MTTQKQLSQAEQRWDEYELAAEAANEMRKEIETKFGYPATGENADSEEQAQMSEKYFEMLRYSRIQKDLHNHLVNGFDDNGANA